MLRTIKAWLSLKVIFGGILFAACIFAVFVGILWASKAKNITTIPATAMLRIIEVPTATPLAPLTTPTLATNPQPSQQAPSQGGNISINDFVQVSGTGGDGLRLHESAGVSSPVKSVALEAEVFAVKAGPVDADGYTWWLLEDPYTPSATGWGVANYLVVVQNP